VQEPPLVAVVSCKLSALQVGRVWGTMPPMVLLPGVASRRAVQADGAQERWSSRMHRRARIGLQAEAPLPPGLVPCQSASLAGATAPLRHRPLLVPTLPSPRAGARATALSLPGCRAGLQVLGHPRIQLLRIQQLQIVSRISKRLHSRLDGRQHNALYALGVELSSSRVVTGRVAPVAVAVVGPLGRFLRRWPQSPARGRGLVGFAFIPVPFGLP
jgi:hypothetical protein